MTDYLEGALGDAARARLEMHLAGCPHCREYLAQLRVVVRVAGQVEPDDMPPEALDDLLAVYRAWRRG